MVERQRRFLTRWRLAAARQRPAFELANLLAAEAANQPPLARRLALLDTLQAAKRPLAAADLMARVEARIGRGCWGGRPRRTLADDMRRLKTAGYRICYSRAGRPGYWWNSAHGSVDPQALRQRIEPAEAGLVQELARLSPDERLAQAAALTRWVQSLPSQPQE